MGLSERLREKMKNRSFTPIDLNEENVQIIFKRCLAKEGDESEDKRLGQLFREERGFDSSSPYVIFSKRRKGESLKQIRYLFGQLQNVHSGCIRMTPASAVKKYTGENWTTNDDTIAALLLLTYVSGLCFPFYKEDGVASANYVKPLLIPTLSPKDPNFPAWWEQHKAEWEDKQ